MSWTWTIEWEEERALDVKEVLCKYGLEKDQQALYALGVHCVSDIPWITTDVMRDPRLTGTVEQYLAMQEESSVLPSSNLAKSAS